MGFVNSVYAQGINIGKEWPLAEVFPDLGSIPTRLLPMALVLGGVIFFLMVIVSGFSILSGAGSEDAAQKAKWHQVLTSGMIGLIIMFGAFWILQIINFITGGALNDILGQNVQPKP